MERTLDYNTHRATPFVGMLMMTIVIGGAMWYSIFYSVYQIYIK
jgi:hypothetical protein